MDVAIDKNTRWPLVRLGDVCEIINGATPSTSNSEYWDGGHAWITPAEMGKLDSPLVSDTRRKITDAGLQNCSAKLVPEYSVILSSRAPIGYVVINEIPMAFNQGCKGLVPGFKMNFQYLYYFLFAKNELLNELGTGTTFKELSSGKLKEILIPLPPLAEQQRIVARLDAAFAAIAEASAAAVANLRNARALFDSYLDQVFSTRGAGWVERRLGDVCDFENGDRGSNYPNRNEYVANGIPWINTGHILPDGRLSSIDMHFITKEKYDSLRSGKIRAGDLVYCLRGATLGKTAITSPYSEGAIASSLVILRPSPNIEKMFLYFFMISHHGQKQIRKFENGAAQPNLGAKNVAQFVIPVPSLYDQKTSIEMLILLREQTQTLQRVFETKLTALTELKQALLAEVFGAGA